MRDFNMSEEQAMNYPTDRAFALAAFQAETNTGCNVERVNAGYIGQELCRLQHLKAGISAKD